MHDPIAYHRIPAEDPEAADTAVPLSVRAASPAHLVASKLAARRPNDIRARAALEQMGTDSSRG